jgi:hypothetical protein
MKEKRYCEICGNFMGEMSLEAYDELDGICEECYNDPTRLEIEEEEINAVTAGSKSMV